MTLVRRRIDFVLVLVVLFAISCSGGGGCGGCGSGCALQPIPGGFAPGKRSANAGQLRVSSTGLAAITANPAQLIGPLVGNTTNGVITFPVTTCGSTSVCCDGQGNAIPNCGPVDIDLTLHNGDLPRLAIVPQNTAAPNGQLNVTVRARVKAEMPLVLSIDGINCTLALDTTKSGPNQDLAITTQISLTQDATSGTTKVTAANSTITQLDSGDYTIGAVNPLSGDIACYAAGFIPASTIEGLIA